MILLLRWWGGWRDFDIQGLEQVCVRRRQGNGVPRLQGSDSQVGLYPPFSFSTLQASSCFPNPGTLLPETSSLTTTRTPKYQILASPGVSIKSQGERSKIFFCRNLRDLGGEMYEQKTKGALPIRWIIIIIFISMYWQNNVSHLCLFVLLASIIRHIIHQMIVLVIVIVTLHSSYGRSRNNWTLQCKINFN